MRPRRRPTTAAGSRHDPRRRRRAGRLQQRGPAEAVARGRRRCRSPATPHQLDVPTVGSRIARRRRSGRAGQVRVAPSRPRRSRWPCSPNSGTGSSRRRRRRSRSAPCSINRAPLGDDASQHRGGRHERVRAGSSRSFTSLIVPRARRGPRAQQPHAFRTGWRRGRVLGWSRSNGLLVDSPCSSRRALPMRDRSARRRCRTCRVDGRGGPRVGTSRGGFGDVEACRPPHSAPPTGCA